MSAITIRKIKKINEFENANNGTYQYDDGKIFMLIDQRNNIQISGNIVTYIYVHEIASGENIRTVNTMEELIDIVEKLKKIKVLYDIGIRDIKTN